MNSQSSLTFIIIASVYLNVTTLATNAQLSRDDDQVLNLSHQSESDDLQINHMLNETETHQVNTDDGWSQWSEWSTCSRSCDGGISVSLRKCNNANYCANGSSERYKICNMQPCPTTIDFRAMQCSAFNNRPYRGRFYNWLSYSDPLDPCSLTCKASTFNFFAKLAPRVKDGTRCRDGSLDMCVVGKCLSVGCDLQLGSDNKVDECGICGGDGSSCKRPIYEWSESIASQCSVSCGKGYQMSHPICTDKKTKEQVDEILCDPSMRPKPQIIECNTQMCPPFWIIENWSACSHKCGGGKQTRFVYCVQDGVNGTRMRVSDEDCAKQKPVTHRLCNLQECPQWFEGLWSECSVSCGSGMQTRAVVCRDIRGFYSNECSEATKPDDKRNCTVGGNCPKEYIDVNESSQEDAPRVLPWIKRLTSPAMSTEPHYMTGEWSPCSVTCGKGIQKRTVECKIFLEFSRTIARLPDSQCPTPKPKAYETCNSGPCRTQLIADEGDYDEDDDDHDNEIINSGVEMPVNKMTPLSKISYEVKYYWKNSGFTQCSASCLGGTQESIIHCIRSDNHSIVNPYLCDINKKLESYTRTCNDHPCPPRWNVTEFGLCSKTCGRGIQFREVHCVHEVTRGASNTIIVENSQCQQPMPPSKQFCNIFDCPPQWRTGPWTKCSRSCGGGEKTRKLKCTKELAFGKVIELPHSKCAKKRPKVIKMCNSKPCRNPMLELRKKLQSLEDNTSPNEDENIFIQKLPKKRILLKVSGTAIVLKGTLIKLRCPRKKFDRNSNHTNWYRNNVEINRDQRVQLIGRNSLRIKNIGLADTAVYSCSWNNRTKHSIDLKVRRNTDGKSAERPPFIGLIFKHQEINDHQNNGIATEEVDNTSHNNGDDKWSFNDLSNLRSKPKQTFSGPANDKIPPNFFTDDLNSQESQMHNREMDTWEVNYGSETHSANNKDVIDYNYNDRSNE